MTTFNEWFTRLQELAFDADHELGEPETYREYYDDGDTPEDTLIEEMSRADDDFEFETYDEEIVYEH